MKTAEDILRRLVAVREQQGLPALLRALGDVEQEAEEFLTRQSNYVDLVARGLAADECDSLIDEQLKQAGFPEGVKGMQPAGYNVCMRVANAAHKAGFTQSSERYAMQVADMREVIEEMHTGLQWYRDANPELVDGSDEELDQRVTLVLEPVAFVNRGEEPDTSALNCPACGGSGHVDDTVKPADEPSGHYHTKLLRDAYRYVTTKGVGDPMLASRLQWAIDIEKRRYAADKAAPAPSPGPEMDDVLRKWHTCDESDSCIPCEASANREIFEESAAQYGLNVLRITTSDDSPYLKVETQFAWECWNRVATKPAPAGEGSS